MAVEHVLWSAQNSPGLLGTNCAAVYAHNARCSLCILMQPSQQYISRHVSVMMHLCREALPVDETKKKLPDFDQEKMVSTEPAYWWYRISRAGADAMSASRGIIWSTASVETTCCILVYRGSCIGVPSHITHSKGWLVLTRVELHATAGLYTMSCLPALNVASQIEGPKQVARRSDMDMNGHINNVTYLAWSLETVPEEIYNSHSLYEVSGCGCGCGYLDGRVLIAPNARSRL